jgi:hypothetical protein
MFLYSQKRNSFPLSGSVSEQGEYEIFDGSYTVSIDRNGMTL